MHRIISKSPNYPHTMDSESFSPSDNANMELLNYHLCGDVNIRNTAPWPDKHLTFFPHRAETCINVAIVELEQQNTNIALSKKGDVGFSWEAVTLR